MEIKTFKDLLVWQKGIALVADIYRATKAFPSEEMYGLTSQIRRCAVSIPSNIAEGYGRKGTGDYLRFLQIAIGSLFELETQLHIARDLEYLQAGDFQKYNEKCEELDRMLHSLYRKLQSSEKRKT